MKYQFEVNGGDFTHAGFVSIEIKKIMQKLHLPPSFIRKMSIANYEAEVNIIAHAYQGKISVEITSEKITTIFKDQGPGIASIDQAMKEGFSTASEKVREMGFGAGMGLPNMKRNSDGMTIDTKLNEGTVVTLIYNIP
ncbi:ATP-binding protein [Halosquirtibacter laminarini]|uniref:ATP-binding protein n=1 Tax=Halosquirtibacter laminarini TaxID=3374600 RepID=A0AC61NGK4_9BACT|nr:ATP-binding protein [Prolixibacteraceae bacterium]